MNIVRVELRDNPAWTPERIAKAKRGGLQVVCHDRTPCADVKCPACGSVQHMHLSQLEDLPNGYVVMMRCHGLLDACTVVFELDRDEAVAALRELEPGRTTSA